MDVSSVDQMAERMASYLVGLKASTKDLKLACLMAERSVDCSDSTKDEKMASGTVQSLDDSMEMMMGDCSDSTKAQKMAS